MARRLRSTERADPRFSDCDLMSTPDLVEKLIRTQEVTPILLRQTGAIARAVGMFTKTWNAGGRIFLVGAGTSGRLAALEAAECPPTFGTDRDRIVALMAGGTKAFHRAVEGAEDDSRVAAKTLQERKVSSKDLVIGVSASSTTPFVAGALTSARARGARTILITCNRVRGKKPADLVIALVVGPEPIAGSTRMKAGTATKICLNTITTAAMVRLNRVYGNRMVCVRGGSDKLRSRAQGLVARIAGVAPARARRLLRASGWDVRTAVLLAKGLSADRAKSILMQCNGNLRKALQSVTDSCAVTT